MEKGCQLVFKRAIAVRPLSQIVPVDPNLAVAIDAVEVNEQLLLFRARRHGKCLSIPTSATGQRAAPSARRILLVESAFDAPVMRQIQLPPSRVIEICVLGVRHITKMKAPVLIEANGLVRPRVGNNTHT